MTNYTLMCFRLSMFFVFAVPVYAQTKFDTFIKINNPNNLAICDPDKKIENWNNCWGENRKDKTNIAIGEFTKGNLNGVCIQLLLTNAGVKTQVYEGYCKENQFSGYGKMLTNEETFFDGNWLNGLPNGKMLVRFKDGTAYEGDMKDGKYHGNGVLSFSDGKKYIGEWRFGKQDGIGTWTFKQGHGYTGQWLNGMPHGKGRATYDDGRPPEEGKFNLGKFTGKE